MKRVNVAIISFHYSDLYKSRKVRSDKMRLSVHTKKTNDKNLYAVYMIIMTSALIET